MTIETGSISNQLDFNNNDNKSDFLSVDSLQLREVPACRVGDCMINLPKEASDAVSIFVIQDTYEPSIQFGETKTNSLVLKHECLERSSSNDTIISSNETMEGKKSNPRKLLHSLRNSLGFKGKKDINGYSINLNIQQSSHIPATPESDKTVISTKRLTIKSLKKIHFSIFNHNHNTNNGDDNDSKRSISQKNNTMTINYLESSRNSSATIVNSLGVPSPCDEEEMEFFSEFNSSLENYIPTTTEMNVVSNKTSMFDGVNNIKVEQECLIENKVIQQNELHVDICEEINKENYTASEQEWASALLKIEKSKAIKELSIKFEFNSTDPIDIISEDVITIANNESSLICETLNSETISMNDEIDHAIMDNSEFDIKYSSIKRRNIIEQKPRVSSVIEPLMHIPILTVSFGDMEHDNENCMEIQRRESGQIFRSKSICVVPSRKEKLSKPVDLFYHEVRIAKRRSIHRRGSSVSKNIFVAESNKINNNTESVTRKKTGSGLKDRLMTSATSFTDSVTSSRFRNGIPSASRKSSLRPNSKSKPSSLKLSSKSLSKSEFFNQGFKGQILPPPAGNGWKRLWMKLGVEC